MNLFKAISIATLSVAIVAGSVGCKKSYLDRLPSDQVPLDSLFKTTAGSRTALEGIHRMMYEENGAETFGQKAIDLMADLMGEDMPISGFGAGWFYGSYVYTDARTGGGTPSYTWGYYFRIINNANYIIKYTPTAAGPDEDRNDIIAQALFYRAFAYYNLSVYYQQTYAGRGDFLGSPIDYIDAPCVPIYLEPTQTGNPRASTRDVYAQITKDLATAIPSLGAKSDKSQISKSVAQGLYARVALVMQDWPKAAEMAEAARQPFPYMDSSQCLTGFNTSANPEWMWASTANNEQLGNAYSSFLSQMDYSANGYSALGMQKIYYKQLANQMGAADVRKNWYFKLNEAPGLVQYSQKKFKQRIPGNWSTDLLWMRSGEMALIEAEAKAHMGQTGAAKTVLENFIQTRDPGFTAPTDKIELLKVILTQRRIELWGEGFRLGDIKRQMDFTVTGNGEAIFDDNTTGLHRKAVISGDQKGDHSSRASGSKDIQAYSRDFLFKIPSTELSANPGMIPN